MLPSPQAAHFYVVTLLSKVFVALRIRSLLSQFTITSLHESLVTRYVMPVDLAHDCEIDIQLRLPLKPSQLL